MLGEIKRGDRVEFVGPTVPGLMYGEHVRALEILDGVTDVGGGNKLIGRWLRAVDMAGTVFEYPAREFEPVLGKCCCDGCTVDVPT